MGLFGINLKDETIDKVTTSTIDKLAGLLERLLREKKVVITIENKFDGPYVNDIKK